MAIDFGSGNNSISRAKTFPGYPFTMACWFRKPSTAYGAVMSYTRTTNAWDNHALLIDNQVVAQSHDGGGSTAIAPGTITLDKWHHAAGIWRASNYRSAWLDGLQGWNTGNRTTGGLGLMNFGRRRLLGGFEQHFNGQIAYAGVWDVELTGQEIASLANGFRPDQVRPQNLLFTFLFDNRILDPTGGQDGTAWTNSGTTETDSFPPIR